MTRGYSETSFYLQHPDTDTLIDAITGLFASEGMVRTEQPGKRLHEAPALQNNRWAVHLLAGVNGWHLLRAKPWNLWCDLPAGVDRNRFIQLLQRLERPGFLLCLEGYYYCGVLIEVNSKGQFVATGSWFEDKPEEDGTLFYGLKLEGDRITPRSNLLQKLWSESRDLWKNGENPDYDDCRGNDEKEIFCHYVARRLLDQKAWDVEEISDWPSEAHSTLYFEYPAGDRPEPPEPPPPPEPDACYPDGTLVQVGDAVLFDEGMTSGRVVNFLYSANSVSMVVLDEDPSLPPGTAGTPLFMSQKALKTRLATHTEGLPKPTHRCIQVFNKRASGLQLVERNTADHVRAAVNFLRERAAIGNVAAMLAYGMRCLKSIGVPRDVQTAYGWLVRVADTGRADVQWLVGKICSDRSEAVRRWHMAAEQGYVRAMFELGVAYHEGDGAAVDLKRAQHWYHQAFAQGNLAAHYNLGHFWMLCPDNQHTTDFDADANWFKEQADKGDAPAQWVMGICAQVGAGGATKNLEEAVRYYRMGAEQNFAPAACNLADKYENGMGVQQDLTQALQLYLKAAEQGVSAALYSLGCMYRDGRGVAQDNAEAARWLKRAADNDYQDAKDALRALPGSSYQQAQLLSEKVRSATATDAKKPTAQQLHEQALAVYDPKDPKALALAFALHQSAAEQGHAHALFQLGFMHLRGFATKANPVRAVELYQQAAALGDPYAPMALAKMYEEGSDIPANPVEARRWYEKAAEQGDTEAQFKLGLRATPYPSHEEMGFKFISVENPPEKEK
jgi:TPR repeat protein